MIERLIVECERKIQRALKRLADEDAKAAIAISVSEVTQVLTAAFFIYISIECRKDLKFFFFFFFLIFPLYYRHLRFWSSQNK